MRARLAAMLMIVLVIVVIRGVTRPRPGRETRSCCLTMLSTCYTLPPRVACFPGDRPVPCPCESESGD